jgi:hypothetical protein
MQHVCPHSTVLCFMLDGIYTSFPNIFHEILSRPWRIL